MKRCTPSPRRRRPRRTLQSAKGDRSRMTLCDLHFAFVSGKLDLSSTERRLGKEKDNFYCINKSVYVTPTVHELCTLLIFASLKDSKPSFASRAVFLRSTLSCVRRNGNYK